MEVINSFKGLNLIDCLKNYGRGFMTLYRRQGPRPLPKGDGMQKDKIIV